MSSSRPPGEEPLVGDADDVTTGVAQGIYDAGMTTAQTAATIAAALANGFMRNPDVAVEIETYRPFFIQGAIKFAGQFPYVSGMTVRAAVFVR